LTRALEAIKGLPYPLCSLEEHNGYGKRNRIPFIGLHPVEHQIKDCLIPVEGLHQRVLKPAE